MQAWDREERRIRSYLLGELEEDDRAAVRERILEEDEFYQRVLAMETDLIDAYAWGDLTSTERQRLEESVLRSRQGRQRLAFAQALLDSQASPGDAAASSAPSSLPRWAAQTSRRIGQLLAAACLVFFLAAGWAWLENRQLRHELRALRVDVQAPEDLSQAPLPPPAAASDQPSALQAYALSAGQVRSGRGSARIRLLPTTSDLQLRLEFDRADFFPSYSVKLRGPDGRDAYSDRSLPSLVIEAGREVSFQVGTQTLPGGRYEIELSGTSADGSQQVLAFFYFDLVRP